MAYPGRLHPSEVLGDEVALTEEPGNVPSEEAPVDTGEDSVPTSREEAHHGGLEEAEEEAVVEVDESLRSRNQIWGKNHLRKLKPLIMTTTNRETTRAEPS